MRGCPPRATGHGARQATPRHTPVGDQGRHPTRRLERVEQDRRATLEQAHHGAEGALGHTLGLVGVLGQVDGDDSRFGGRPLQLLHHERAGVRSRAPVDEPPAVTGAVRAAPRGRPASARGRSTTTPASSSRARVRRRHPPEPRRDVEGVRQGDPHPAGPPLQGERCGRGDVECHGLVHPAPDRHQGDAFAGDAPAHRPCEGLGTGGRRPARADGCWPRPRPPTAGLRRRRRGLTRPRRGRGRRPPTARRRR